LICPICSKHKAKRMCPARAESICTTCCGTEREVTIDCPSDCLYLVESREHDNTRREFDWSKLPFAETRIPMKFAQEHGPLILALDYGICAYAGGDRAVVDEDVLTALQALGESYRTLTSGIYYEQAPNHSRQRGVYDALKSAIDDFRKEEAKRAVVTTTHDSDIRDALIFLCQLGATRTNGRRMGRAYLDLLRAQFPEQEFQKPASNIVLL
jgi:hypothetical protein